MNDYRNWRWACPHCGYAHMSRGYLAADIADAVATPTKCPNCLNVMPAPRLLEEERVA
jgi:predicted RNA-binding Zn-ribbon protein involved in translation (DUF1610 family)